MIKKFVEKQGNKSNNGYFVAKLTCSQALG
jgi:hypothetical protein